MLIKKRKKKSGGEGAVPWADLKRRVTYCFETWSQCSVASYRIQAWKR